MKTYQLIVTTWKATASALAAVLFAFRKRLWQIREGMPQELRTAVLLLSESPLWTRKPLCFYGIPDQVYLALDGELILVDTKSRRHSRVTLSDVIQMSVYLLLLRHSRHPAVRGRGVRPYAYVRCETDNKVEYLAVHLLGTEEIMRFASAYLRQQHGRAADFHDHGAMKI
jgi:hypothetical protein